MAPNRIYNGSVEQKEDGPLKGCLLSNLTKLSQPLQHFRIDDDELSADI